jgi:hypothetical protein
MFIPTQCRFFYLRVCLFFLVAVSAPVGMGGLSPGTGMSFAPHGQASLPRRGQTSSTPNMHAGEICPDMSSHWRRIEWGEDPQCRL